MTHVSGSAADKRPTTAHKQTAASDRRRSSAKHGAEKTATLVWIDSRNAYVVRWHKSAAFVDRFESDVPAHHRTTGVGSGLPQVEVEGRRLEHLARFVAHVAGAVPTADDVLVLGPGTVRDHLARELTQADLHARRNRRVACRAAASMTERQLIALLRIEIGEPPPRKKQTRRTEHKAPVEAAPDPYAELAELDLDTNLED